jgi:PTS system beta-glucosides-specific IIC component
MNIIHALVATAISFLVAGLTAAALWKDALEHVPADTETTSPVAVTAPRGSRPEGADLLAPLAGRVIPLTEVKDAVFAGGALGQGVAILPTSGDVRSPADGLVATVFSTHHAIAITTDAGAEVLIHVGLDTVKLGGKHFDTLVVKGERVTAGQVLIRADLDAIRAEGYDTTTPVVVLNSQKFDVTSLGRTQISAGEPLIAVDEKVLVS